MNIPKLEQLLIIQRLRLTRSEQVQRLNQDHRRNDQGKDWANPDQSKLIL